MLTYFVNITYIKSKTIGKQSVTEWRDASRRQTEFLLPNTNYLFSYALAAVNSHSFTFSQS